MNGRASDGLAMPLRLHYLLLALAGRVDDSALNDARELIARSRADEAAELITGTLIAGRVPVREAEQEVLTSVLEQSRSDAGLAGHLTVAEGTVDVPHRFSGDDEPGHDVADAVERVLAVLPDVRSLHAVWRRSSAGSVPGPLPQRVILVEVGAEGTQTATAYRVQAALRQAGISAVVEVAGAGVEWPAYHRAALASAVPVWRAAKRAAPASEQRPTAERQAPAPPERPAPPPTQQAPAAQRAPAVQPPTSAQQQPAEPERADVEVLSEIHPRWWEVAGEDQQASAQPEAEQTLIARPVQPPETRSESTADMSAEEQSQLKAALAADSAEGTKIAEAEPPVKQTSDETTFGESYEGEGPSSVPQLSDRDRLLLAKLHEELAKREKAAAEQVRANGSDWAHERPRWSAG